VGKGHSRRQGEDAEKFDEGYEAAFPKLNPERDKKYRAWVRTHPCLACGISGEIITDHHIESLGTGIKCSDYLTVSLCNDHHRAVERSRDAFEHFYMLDLKEEAERLKGEWDAKMGNGAIL